MSISKKDKKALKGQIDHKIITPLTIILFITQDLIENQKLAKKSEREALKNILEQIEKAKTELKRLF